MITERSIKLLSSVMLISANRIKVLILAGVSLPPSSRVPRVSLAPKTPFPLPFKRLPRKLVFDLNLQYRAI